MANGSALRGIAAYQERKQEQEARRAASASLGYNRFGFEKANDTVVVRFAQEIDPNHKNYSEDRGLGFVNIEHRHPDPKSGWRNRANCTLESQGDCFPCDKVRDRDVEWDDRKGWKQKENFYLNVVAGPPREVELSGGKTKQYPTDIDRDTGDGEVYLLSQSTYNGIWDQLVEEATESETITQNYFKIKMKGGEFNNTSYVLTKLGEIPDDAKSLDEFELVDIDEQLKEVPYEQQEAFYFKGMEEPVGAAASHSDASAGSTGTEEGW